MKAFREKFIETYILVIFVLIMLLIIPIVSTILVNHQLKKDTSETEIYAQVSDKYSNTVMAGKVPIKKYYINVKLQENNKEYTIQISSNEYSLIEIGDEVFCTLYYKKDQLIDIELGNVKEKFKDTTDFNKQFKTKGVWM